MLRAHSSTYRISQGNELHVTSPQNLERASQDVTGTQLRPEISQGTNYMWSWQNLARASQDVTGTQLRPEISQGNELHAIGQNLARASARYPRALLHAIGKTSKDYLQISQGTELHVLLEQNLERAFARCPRAPILHAIGKTSKDHLQISQGNELHAHLHNLIHDHRVST